MEDLLEAGVEFFDSPAQEDEAPDDDKGARVGELVSVARRDCDLLASCVCDNLASFIRSGQSAVFQLAMCFYISPPLTAVSLISLPVVGVLAMVYGKKTKRLTKRYEDAVTKIVNALHEKVTNITTVKAFAQEKRKSNTLR